MAVTSRRALASLAALAFAQAAQAQEPLPTIIVPDTGPLGLGTQVTQAGNLRTIDGGARAGRNLFHSFSRFDLGRGDVAQWVRGAGDGASILNVVNRVTGGDPSDIHGRIDSTALPNADFWFINPAGIVFGPGAQVNVPAAAYFSTAQELRFASGPAFAIATPGGSTLSVAAPSAFGFLADSGTIQVNGAAQDFLPDRGQLFLAARAIAVRDSFLVGSTFDMRAVGPAGGIVDYSDPFDVVALDGRVDMLDSVIRVVPNPARQEYIRVVGGPLTVTRSNLGTGAGSGPGFGIGRPIQLVGSDIRIFASLVSAATFGGGPAGDIMIRGGAIDVSGNSVISSDSLAGSTGASGLIVLVGDSVSLSGARVTASTSNDQAGGAIILQGADIRLGPGAQVSSLALAGSSASAGFVRVKALRLTMAPGSVISSSTFGTGPPGTILLYADESIDVDGARITSESGRDFLFRPEEVATPGFISVETGALNVRNGALFSTGTRGSGPAGTVAIDARSVSLSGGSTIESSALPGSSGPAGEVRIAASETVSIDNGSIRTSTSGSGPAGRIEIRSADIALVNGGAIASSSLLDCPVGAVCAQGADAGDIDIQADRIRVTGNLADPNAQPGFTRIASDTNGSGRAGRIAVSGRESIVIEDNARISSTGQGQGAAGVIALSAPSIALRRLATLSTDTSGSGAGGAVFLTGDAIVIEQAASVSATTGSQQRAPGGLVSIAARDVAIRENALVTTSTRGNGDAGRVELVAGTLLIDNRSAVTSDTFAAGSGGQVFIDAGTLAISDGRISSTTFGPGDAGEIDIAAGSLRLEGGAISTSTGPPATGRAGRLRIAARDILMSGGSSIDSVSTNANPSGEIDITARTIRLEAPASISSANVSTRGGDAGRAVIRADAITLAGGAEITTSAKTGAAGDIRIELPTDGFLILDSLASPSLITTSSGPGTGGRIDIADAFAIISNGGAILALGQSGGANVGIRTRYFISSSDRTNRVAVDGNFLLEAAAYDVSSGTVTRDLSVLDASGVLRGQCASARATGAVSQLVVRPVGPYGRAAPPPPPQSGRPDTIAGLADPATSCS